MEFLDKLVLPQSAEHIELLHYMLMLVLFLFVPFISIVFGGTSLSLFFGRKGRKENNSKFIRFSKDIIELVTLNNSIGVILGMIPLLTAILIFAQLLHTTTAPTTGYLALSLLFVVVGLVMIYTYRHSFTLKLVLDSTKSNPDSESYIVDEYNKYKNLSGFLSSRYGKIGLFFLFIGLWTYVGAITTAIYFSDWTPSGFFALLFNGKVLLNFILLLCFSFTLTGGVVLFVYLYWKRDEIKLDDDYKTFLTNLSSRTALYFSLPIPFLLMINLFVLPGNFLTGTVFTYAIIAIVLVFLADHLIYLILYKRNFQYSSLLFFIMLFAVGSLIIKDQITISNSTKLHSLVLSEDYNRILAELKGDGSGVEINAAELYQVRCASCHKFDQKLVGPPHNEVLPKYVGKEAQLVAFIRNPVKIDPAYPPMPNPGLKPQEAEAVAKYLLETFESNKK